MESTPGPLVKTGNLRLFKVEQGHPGLARFTRPHGGSLSWETVHAADGSTRLCLEGALQARTAVAFKQGIAEVLRELDGPLTIDLAHVRRLDPTGLASLAEVCELGRRAGRRVLVAHMPAGARRWIALASLHKVIEISE